MTAEGKRLAKRIAESGLASRREAEKLIESGRVKVNGVLVNTPVFFVSDSDTILVDDVEIFEKSSEIKIWKFYKPNGVVTSKRDAKGRLTVFDYFDKYFEENGATDKRDRLLYIGRLDLNSEGLLLFTNNGDLARKMELPKTALPRTYRVRIFGSLSAADKDKVQRGEVVIDGIQYAPAKIIEERKNSEGFKESKEGSKNRWLRMELTEGKNREIRKLMDYFGCSVNKLIRTNYGPFSLSGMNLGEIKRVSSNEVSRFLRNLQII